MGTPLKTNLNNWKDEIVQTIINTPDIDPYISQINHFKEVVDRKVEPITNAKDAEQTLKVALCEDIRWQRCDIKSTSLLGNVLSMNEAKDQACDEVIMYKENKITEGGASNVFFIKNTYKYM